MLTEAQQRIRAKGIGGSEIGALAGLNPWMGPIDVWQRKMGVAEDVEGPHIERGQHLEPALIRWYSTRTGRDVEPGETTVHPEHPIVIATPDGLTRDGDLHLVLEIKAPHWRTAAHWGEPGTDEIPEYYVPQVTWEMGATGREAADVAALIGGDLQIYRVLWNQELFEGLLEIAERFWRDHIETGNPPPPDGSESALEWLRRKYPQATRDMLESNGQIEAMVYDLHAATAALEDAERMHEACKQRLIEAIGEHEGVIGPWGKILYRNQAGRSRTDWKAVAREAGIPHELIEKHTKCGKPFRTFRTYLKIGD